MDRYVRSCITAAGFAMLSLSPLALAVDTSEIGMLGNPNSYTRTIEIRPQTKSVNVMKGEVVKLVDQATGKSFVWNFDTWGNKSFDLTAVAPAGMLDHKITAYVCEPTAGCDGE